MCTLLCRSRRHENIGVITVEAEEATQHFYLDKRSKRTIYLSEYLQHLSLCFLKYSLNIEYEL